MKKNSLEEMKLAMPVPVWVIGSYGPDGAANLMTASWCGLCCSEPPCVAMSLRPSRLSHGNIIERKAFTVNIPSRQYLAETDFFGMISGKTEDKFSATSLTPVHGKLVDAPYIKEFPLALECVLLRVIELGSHTHFIGEIVDVRENSSVPACNEQVDTARLAPIVCVPANKCYFELGQILGSAYFSGHKYIEAISGTDHNK